MKLCKLICVSPIDIFLEDIGVRLSGRGSSKLVDSELVFRSQDLKKFSNFIQIEHLPESKPMPIWPFMKSQPSVSPVLPSTPVVSPDFSERLDELGRQQAEILSLLRSGNSPHMTASTPSSPVSIQPSSEPMFIPSQIVPETQGIRVKVQEGEVSKSDVEASREALRKLKKGK